MIETVSRVIRGGPWKPEKLSRPFKLAPKKLEALGRHASRDWFVHPDMRGCELEAHAELLDPSREFVPDILPDEPFVSVLRDGRLLAQMLTRHEPGTYARLTTVVPKQERPPKAQEFLDALVRFDGLGLAGVRGLPEIEARLLARGGLRIVVTPDSNGVMGTGEGGYSHGRGFGAKLWAVDVFEALHAPFLEWKRDKVIPVCIATAHKQPVPMRTITVGGRPWCGECRP